MGLVFELISYELANPEKQFLSLCTFSVSIWRVYMQMHVGDLALAVAAGRFRTCLLNCKII